MTPSTPPFTDEHEELRTSARGFIERELAPHAQQWEDERWFPDEVFGKMAAQGLLGLKYPESYGGQGGDYLHEAVLVEELARTGSGGTAAGIGAHINIATPPIFKFGTEDQKQRYLVPAIAGEKIGALAITEPGAGSDVAALSTRAERVDGGWVVNGEKTYITNGVRAHFMVTAVKSTPEGGHSGISFLIVERGEGVESSKLEKLGWHASDTATIAFQDVFVPEENLLGELHGGFRLIMANFQWERLAMALGAVGAMQIAWERTAQFARERETFGRPLSGHQAIRHKLADMATSVYTCRCVTYDALRRFVAGEEPLKEVTMAKLLTQRASFELMDECLQIHGGAGYMKGDGSPSAWVERAARDSRLGPIGGGSDEIMREILGRVLGL
ncbi:MAG TPA: acyl-CoA dehydrogenase family protein [Solirubrobacteraceae bacterium]|jgi:acyl-CoA dehydrogenase|nr:acyl-CoA dehydrogenase family protein [Solirubrobacteraceae bacterium]